MGQISTGGRKILVRGLTAAAAVSILQAQLPPADWARIGGTAIDWRLASAASGPVDRVWYSAAGDLLIQTASGRTFAWADESWRPAPVTPPGRPASPEAARLPEPAAAVVEAGNRHYAYGEHVYRSDDGGRSWQNLTAFRGVSILGGRVRDCAVAPNTSEVLVAATDAGVWRSADGGLSWAGWNETLPNLPARRILVLPDGRTALRVEIDDGRVLEWPPGEKAAWRPADDSALKDEQRLRRTLSDRLGVAITAVSTAGAVFFAGSADGRLWSSVDGGATWDREVSTEGGAVSSVSVDARDARFAIAVLARRAGGARRPRLVRTINGGIFWDDITANLPDTGIHAVAADRPSGVLYAATDVGIFTASLDLFVAGPAAAWVPLQGSLPAAPVVDVKLDAGGNRLYAAVSGWGVFTSLAPHRARQPRVVSAADYVERAAAPGALLSVVGARVTAARAGEFPVPLMAAGEQESQIQVPFEVSGESLALGLAVGSLARAFALPLAAAAPAIFIDRDGSPMILDAESGVLLDASRPARAGSRVQILATGLGRVRPNWPTGMAAPLEEPPRVVAAVRALLNGAPLEVLQATLAPGYVGFYLVEVQLPAIVNRGLAELVLEVSGRASNTVRIPLEP